MIRDLTFFDLKLPSFLRNKGVKEKPVITGFFVMLIFDYSIICRYVPSTSTIYLGTILSYIIRLRLKNRNFGFKKLRVVGN